MAAIIIHVVSKLLLGGCYVTPELLGCCLVAAMALQLGF